MDHIYASSEICGDFDNDLSDHRSIFCLLGVADYARYPEEVTCTRSFRDDHIQTFCSFIGNVDWTEVTEVYSEGDIEICTIYRGFPGLNDLYKEAAGGVTCF